jgi:hypothetical protein
MTLRIELRLRLHIIAPQSNVALIQMLTTRPIPEYIPTHPRPPRGALMRRHLRGAGSGARGVSHMGHRARGNPCPERTTVRTSREASASPPAGITTGCHKADRKPGGSAGSDAKGSTLCAGPVGQVPAAMSRPVPSARWSAGDGVPKSRRGGR